MSFRDALVVVEQVFGNFCCDALAIGLDQRQIFFSGSFFRFDCGALRANGFFHFFQAFFGGLDAAIVFFAGHHLLEQAIFGFRDFLFGHLHFVLKSFIGFVGFDLGGLVAVFADAFFVLLDVEFVFLAVFYRGELRGFALLELGFRGSDAGIEIGDFFGKSGESGANIVEPNVYAL